VAKRPAPSTKSPPAVRPFTKGTFSQAVDATLSDDQFSAVAVFGRMKEALGADTDAELAWIMGTSPQSLSNRRKRNSVPYREAVYVSLLARVSLDYLLTGGDTPPKR
jgi:hypothetical protein